MFLDPKLRGHEPAKVLEASGNVEDAIAALALKMVMVPFAGALVAHRLARNLNGFDPAVFQERAHRSIDGRNAEPSNAPRRDREHLVDAQGTLGVL